MLPTLTTLLHRPELALTLVSAADALAPGALERPVQWAHASDLADPTPFLVDDQLLLTTGTQFGPDAAPAGSAELDADAYVARLVARGVVGLGFGTEVIRAGTPDALVAACARYGLPLFEVPYRVPFIAIARLTADLIATDAFARHTWALDAQRAISIAALRADGLHAALAELARALGRGVALFDAGGTLDRVFPADAISPIALGGVRRDVTRLLARGDRASTTAADGTLTLHTLGRRGHLRGVLAVGGGTAIDQPAREVVASVVGLASLALEQDRDLDLAIGQLRTGLMRLALAGEDALVDAVGGDLTGALPRGELLLAAVAVSADQFDGLDAAVESHSLFFGRVDGALVVLVPPAHRATLDSLAEAFGARIGVSAPASVATLVRAHAQALRALEATAIPEVVDFTALAGRGVLAALGTDAREVARAALAPLVEHDAANGTDLVATVRSWLEHDAQFDRAAQALGVHRHTVRSRVAAAERVLGVDLAHFPARAELWAALSASA